MILEKRQRLIEIIITIGGLIGIFLAVFQMSFYVFIIFPVFILFSFIYYISVLEDYEKSASSLFLAFMISMSFSSLFILLLARGMSGVSIPEIAGLTFVFGILSFFLTIELSGYSIDIKVVKTEDKKK